VSHNKVKASVGKHLGIQEAICFLIHSRCHTSTNTGRCRVSEADTPASPDWLEEPTTYLTR